MKNLFKKQVWYSDWAWHCRLTGNYPEQIFKDYPPEDWLGVPFRWSTTREGWDYWNNREKEWHKTIRETQNDT